MVPTSNCTKNAAKVVHQSDQLIVTTLFSVIGFPGNILVIILILRAKKKKSTTTYLLLNLAIADIAYLLGKEIAKIAIYLNVQCRMEKKNLLLMTLAAKIVANITLTMIALERYNALVKTMKPLLNITRKKILGSIIIAWFTALLLCLPPTFLPTPMSKQKGCIHPVFSPLVIVFGYVVPLLIVVFCYSSILKCLFFNRTILAAKVTDEASLREKKRLVRVLIVITFVFLACNLPKIVIIYAFNCRRYRLEMLILECLSSSINPFLYGLHSKNYRSQIKRLFCRKKEKENVAYARCSNCNTRSRKNKPQRMEGILLPKLEFSI